MTRKRIQIINGGVAPSPRVLWSFAAEKLREAEAAIAQMENAINRMEYESGWSQFVDSLEEFWVRFYDEGKATFTNFQPWAGTRVAERKSDDLLQYLRQARHQSQHGRIAIQWGESELLVAPNFNGHIRELKIFHDGTYELDSTPLYPTLPDATVEHDAGAPTLPVIENKRNGQKFDPPVSFDGKPIRDRKPTTVAQIGLDYYKHVFAQAISKFSSEDT